MESAVCTVYDGHYHYGVAALANSLYNRGFKGSFYVGYRGDLPYWANPAERNLNIGWEGSLTFHAAENFNIHFLPVNTEFHLTNYKADFMLQLLAGPAKNATALAYFDPDIVIKCRWSFFEEWMTKGVALVHEVVHNDMPASHPVRLEWEKVVTRFNKTPVRKLQSYINGGFCGVSRDNIEFIETWAGLINMGIEYYGVDPKKFSSFDRTYPFWSIDQDALNMTAMCSDSPISEIGPDGMDFVYGGYVMSHATGTPKPWKKKYIWALLSKASLPSRADKAFWQNVLGPIPIFSSNKLKIKNLSMSISGFIGRFYRRR